MSGPQPKGTPGKSVVPTLSEDTIRRMLDQQGQEATLRSQELGIRKQELDYQSKHASDILGAQERDREAERTHRRKQTRDKLVFALLVTAGILGFAVWGLSMNKDTIVKDILQVVLGATLGGVGGFGIGRNSKKQDPEEDD